MLPIDSQRPDPDALLAQVQAQERRAARGKLRIYFGASAGVGKTYAMLAAARKLQGDGQQVLVGVVETHGRAETAAMLDGLDVLPLKSVEYRGKSIAEFDIDAALERRPPLILMDELAHTNAPGSRHPKRWQDVEELLDAGIDVLTTVNVQHLESLNDVVGGITGIRVGETVPDTVFDLADEVVLVDIPADELLARLKSGKVYQEQQAERASKNFFRKGNLIALRELALRRTADRIEDDVRAYRVEKSIDAIWKTGAALLALVGPRPGCDHTVRSTARLAGQPRGAAHGVVAAGSRADQRQQGRAGFPDRVDRLLDAVGAHVVLDAVGGAAQRQLAQRDQIPLAEKILGRAFGLLFLIHLAALQARQQFVGRDIDQHHFVGQVEHRVRHGLADADAGDAADDVVEAFQMLDVDGGEHVDAGVEQFLDILPALGMARTGRVGMRQFVHQDQRRPALQRRVDIEFGDALAAIFDRLQGQHIEAVEHGRRLGAAVGLDHADQHLLAIALQFTRGGQHGVGLADAGRGAEIDAQLAARGAPFLRLHLRQQGVGVRPLAVDGEHES